MKNRRLHRAASPAMLSATVALLPVAVVLLVVAGSTVSDPAQDDRSRVEPAGSDATHPYRAVPGPGPLQEGIYVVKAAPIGTDRKDAEGFRHAEVARIRGHLAGALERLRTSTPPGLTAAQVRARERAISWELREIVVIAGVVLPF